MDPTSSHSQSATRSGPGLDDLVADLLAQHEGQSLTRLAAALDQLCRVHPGQARSLRRRFRLLAEMGMLDAEPDQAPPREIPDRLGEFELLERLGQGGMGVVYRASQPSLGREVALKLVRPEQLWFDGARERFQHEVRTVARLSHPGIVPVHAVGEEDGLPWFAMELVRGATLAQVLRALRGRRAEELCGADLLRAAHECMGSADEDAAAAELPDLFQGSWSDACLRIVRAVAEALEHAHRLNVLHRDLKPSNIMLTPEGRVMLLDFGLSSEEGGSQASRTAATHAGSLPYMAPELLDGAGRPGRRSDVYGLGVTLYELFSLNLPYQADSSQALRARVVEARPRPLREFNKRITWEAETVCRCAMERDPGARYATSADLALDLSNVLEGRPIVARRPGPVRRARRLIEAHPVVGASLLVLAIAAPTTWGIQQARANRQLSEKQVQLEVQGAALAEANRQLEGAIETSRSNLGLALTAVDEFLGRMGAADLVDMPRVEPVRRALLARAVELFEEMVGTHPDADVLVHKLSRAHFRAANAYARVADHERAIEGYQTQIRLLEGLIASGGSSPHDLAHDLNRADAELGDVLNRQGRYEEAIEVQSRALERSRRFVQRWPDSLDARMDEAIALTRLAQPFASRGDYELALPLTMEAIERLEALVRDDPQEPGPWPKLCNNYWLAGIAHKHAGRMDEALEASDAGLAAVSDFLALFPDSSAGRMLETRLWNQMGELAAELDGPEAALPLYAENVERLKALDASFPGVINIEDMVFTGLANLGATYVMCGDPGRGVEFLQHASARVRALRERVPGSQEYALRDAMIDGSLAEGYRQIGEPGRARQLLGRAIPAVEAELERHPGRLELSHFLAQLRVSEADLSADESAAPAR